jgi:hypothetical protein
MLDIFKSDAFSVVSLTDAINQIPYVPTGLAGLFRETSVTTLTIAIEQKNGVLTLVPPSERGSPGQTIDKPKRSMLDIRVPHFERNDFINADEVQNVRAWGEESLLETVQGKVAERLADHSQDFEATAEYHRIGAIKGVITYADGSTLDLFSTFGVSQEAEVDFDLDNASPASGAFRKKCDQTVRLIAGNLGGTPYAGVAAEVGDAFWDDLIAHKEVRETYLNQVAAAELRTGTVYQTFNFGGINWRNYRGSVGGTSFVPTDKAHLYPVGVPGLFRCFYAPADYIETVNTPGQRLYVKQYPAQNGKGIHLDVQMNALHMCTRPKALIKAKRT